MPPRVNNTVLSKKLLYIHHKFLRKYSGGVRVRSVIDIYKSNPTVEIVFESLIEMFKSSNDPMSSSWE